jgi:hypothetical protein
MIVEVFRTNVSDTNNAEMLVEHIHNNFDGFRANFDLDDCDNILRVASPQYINTSLLIDLLNAHGFDAEVLPE